MFLRLPIFASDVHRLNRRPTFRIRLWVTTKRGQGRFAPERSASSFSLNWLYDWASTIPAGTAQSTATRNINHRRTSSSCDRLCLSVSFPGHNSNTQFSTAPFPQRESLLATGTRQFLSLRISLSLHSSGRSACSCCCCAECGKFRYFDRSPIEHVFRRPGGKKKTKEEETRRRLRSPSILTQFEVRRAKCRVHSFISCSELSLSEPAAFSICPLLKLAVESSNR